MLRPAHRVANSAGFFRPRRGAIRVCHTQERIFGNAAVLLHHLGRVARKMTLQELKYTTWMLKRLILLVFAQIGHDGCTLMSMPALGSAFAGRVRLLIVAARALVHPTCGIVGFLLVVPTGEHPS